MININLLPEKMQRRRRRKGILPAGVVLPREVVIGLVGGFIVLLALGNILLQMVVLVRHVYLKNLESRWEKVLPEKLDVDHVIKELRSRQSKVQAIHSLRGAHGILWSRKMQSISAALTRGVWLRRIAFEGDELLINGSSVSKHKVEMINVHSFLKALKEDEVFMKGVASAEIESIKSKEAGGLSVADFTIRVTLMQEEKQPVEKKPAEKKPGKAKKGKKK